MEGAPALASFRLTEEYIEKLTKKPLEVFLRNKGKPYSGSKSDLMSRINSMVDNGEIQPADLYQWWLDALRDSNRHLYICVLSEACCRRLAQPDILEELLRAHSFATPSIAYQPCDKGRQLIMSHVVREEDSVKKLNLGFVERKVKIDFDASMQTIMRANYSYRSFIEIDFEERRLRLFLDQTQGLYEPDDENTSVSSQKTAESIIRELRETLGIELIHATHYGRTLYLIHKEANEVIPFEIREKLRELAGPTRNYLKCVENHLGIDLLDSEAIAKRIESLLERILVQSGEVDFGDEFYNKTVSVLSFRFRDDSGARVDARSFPDSHLYETDIFHDVRDTIDGVGSLLRVHVYWKGIGEIDKDISTILASFPMYLQVIFRKSVVREEIDRVLSLIGEFEERISSDHDQAI